jgi:hypothetical protein
MRAFLNDARVKISNIPGWIVWHHHSRQMSQRPSLRLAASQVYSHTKLIDLIERTDGDPDILLAFFERCMRLGRDLYLSGFRREAIEILSIPWSRGYTKHNGPFVESVLANYLGAQVVLSARSFVSDIKRRALAMRTSPS